MWDLPWNWIVTLGFWALIFSEFGCFKVLMFLLSLKAFSFLFGWKTCLMFLTVLFLSIDLYCGDEQLTCKKISLCVGSSMQLNCYAWLLSTHIQHKYVFFNVLYVNIHFVERVKMDILLGPKFVKQKGKSIHIVTYQSLPLTIFCLWTFLLELPTWASVAINLILFWYKNLLNVMSIVPGGW